jgi:hypothetical protein
MATAPLVAVSVMIAFVHRIVVLPFRAPKGVQEVRLHEPDNEATFARGIIFNIINVMSEDKAIAFSSP